MNEMTEEANEQGAEETEETETTDENPEGRTPNVVDDTPLGRFPVSESSNELPDWAVVPEGMQAPLGTQIGFMRFKASWTMNPSKGDRVCIIWSLTDLDERHAHQRVKDNMNSAAGELSKQMIRVVDGVKVDHGARRGKTGNIDDFWTDIGPKCRSMVTRYWSQTHTMDVEEAAYFFEHCVAVRTLS